MSPSLNAFCIAIAIFIPASAQAANWEIHHGPDKEGAVLTFDTGNPVSYRFECTAKEVIVTETGVTKLIDLKSGQPIGDGAGAAMPEGAAIMALFGGKGDPQFIPAEATKNPKLGWDLTIRLSKTDKQLKAIGKSEMMSLFTTGYTMAVAMDSEARSKWNEFMQRCRISTH